MKKNILGIIPARYASTRFPGKPLASVHGQSMISRVYKQARQADVLSRLVVATDDERIFTHVQAFGGEAVMTSVAHQSGTDRCAEVLTLLSKQGESFAMVMNIQGDEPFISIGQISLLADCMEHPDAQLGTLVKKISREAELFNPNTVKVVLNAFGRALYFSRAAIPHQRRPEMDEWLNHHTYYKHIGLYAYRAETLLEISRLQPTALELAEQLEQLRWLEAGYEIRTSITEQESLAVDTPEDLERINSQQI